MAEVSITADGVQFGPLTGVRVHPAAELFPLLDDEQLEELVADIAEHGLREPIVFTPDGQLLDGRNRYKACLRLDIEPDRRVERGEPWEYVISANVRRRHLSESQRAMVAAHLAERQRGQFNGNQHTRCGPAGPHLTQKQTRTILNVSHGSLVRAKRVRQFGTNPLIAAVEAGKVPVASADRVVHEMDADGQNAYVRRVRDGQNPRSLQTVHPAEDTPSEPARGATNSYYRRSDVLSRASLSSIVSTMSGTAHGLADITAVADLTVEEARAHARELRKSLAPVRALIRTLESHQEHTS